MKYTRALLVAMGIVLIALAGIIYTYEIADPVDIVNAGPAFAPATGTEGFIFGTVEQDGVYSVESTGIFQSMGDVFYGTLYTSDKGYWMIVDPRGQVPVSGCPGSPMPEVML